MKDVELYPSSWYYNACVHGFLEVLACGLGHGGEDFIEREVLKSDGRAVIPGDLMEAALNTRSVPVPPEYDLQEVPDEVSQLKRIAWWWAVKSYELDFVRRDDRERALSPVEIVETVIRSLCHKSGLYPNLIQIKWPSGKKIDFLNSWFVPEPGCGSVYCSFCGQACSLGEGERLYDLFFTSTLSVDLGSSPGVFPNLFWDGSPNLIICKHCRSYFLCFHIIYRAGFFINSGSFLSNWYLNRILLGKMRNANWDFRSLTDAMHYDLQLRRAVGGWELQGLEAIIFTREKGITCYPISATVAGLLIIPEISSLIGRTGSAVVWDVFLRERFDYLPVIVYKSLRAHLKGGENREQDTEVVGSGTSGMRTIVDIAQLYFEIKRNIVRGGAAVSHVDLREIRRAAGSAPVKVYENADRGLVFRLLELTRLNKKADAYHLLMRIYLTRGVPFPEALARLFETSDAELFKNGVYAFIAGLPQVEGSSDELQPG